MRAANLVRLSGAFLSEQARGSFLRWGKLRRVAAERWQPELFRGVKERKGQRWTFPPPLSLPRDPGDFGAVQRLMRPTRLS